MTSGSSPLARGKFEQCFDAGSVEGFIPTRAGKIHGSSQRLSGSSVHPHSRGENLDEAEQFREDFGSSPLARGKSSATVLGDNHYRFIPTRAGKMDVAGVTNYPRGVHPHSRGENVSLGLSGR